MPTKHIDKLIEAYLDERLLPQARRQVETHLKECPECSDHLFVAERVEKQLRPTMRAALGQPILRPMLHQKIRQALPASEARRSFYSNWRAPAQFLNTIGTVAIIALLALGASFAIQSQLPQTDPIQNPTSQQTGTNREMLAKTTPTPLELPQIIPTSPPTNPSLGDTLSLATPSALLATPGESSISAPSRSKPDNQLSRDKLSAIFSSQPEPEAYSALELSSEVDLPDGTIAFALRQPPPGPQSYEIHFINPDGTDHRQFPLGGVSEPALHPSQTERPLAFRAWSEPTSPRSILRGDMEGKLPQSLTNFWEDAQPDWSPTENRIIFASQRESDRYWRLYSVWGDGALEVNLRREGKSPTFAPDGYRFAFESCDSAGNPCGLWVGDLDHSEYGSKPILADPLAKSPDWSPLTEEIAYMANPDGNWDLYLIQSDGSHVRRLTDDPASDGLPTWSPDGQWLAFVSDRGGAWGIWLLRLRDGRLHQTITFDEASWIPVDRLPYNEHGQRHWWDEQLSWGPGLGERGLESGD